MSKTISFPLCKILVNDTVAGFDVFALAIVVIRNGEKIRIPLGPLYINEEEMKGEK